MSSEVIDQEQEARPEGLGHDDEDKDIKLSDENRNEMKQTLQDNIKYHKKHYEYYETYLEDLSKVKYTWDLEELEKKRKKNKQGLPKKPKKFKPTEKPKNVKQKWFLSKDGINLLNELKSHVLEKDKNNSQLKELDEYDDSISKEEEISDIVKKCDKELDKPSDNPLRQYINYGLWLEKLRKLKPGHFEKFVLENLKHSVTHVKNIRNVARLCNDYKKLANVDLNFTDMKDLHPKLYLALKDHPEQAEFWRQA
ncbi:uncharacterized protein LOC131927004 [Physella acuta]|uniref:uncharacterized protein LOC131927004 n=1 Tax=Physella acuta TaxID=109671 RepID=UPI0027DB5C99|nr:uncharacterized protein LOC131927004 [Physella acuta]XP_059138629.1 uncharacterized protein LOC131927004 [Physella acuta]